MFDTHLTAFTCVADCGSFNKAAEKLFLSPSAVMKQINALEKHLGLKLLERSNQGIRLTPAGRTIYRHAKFLFEYSDRAIAEARREAKTAETTFRIGSSLLNPCKSFMDLWYQVDRELPGYKLHIVPFEDDHRDILEEIGALGEKYDFMIGVCDSTLWMERCRFVQLGTYQHCVAVPREHRLAHWEKIRLQDLRGETLMMVKRGDSETVDGIRAEVLACPGIQIEDTAQFYDMEVFNRCAQTGNVMVTIECWKGVHPGLVTIPMEWDHPIPYGILYPKEPSEEIRAFLDAAERYLSRP